MKSVKERGKRREEKGRREKESAMGEGIYREGGKGGGGEGRRKSLEKGDKRWKSLKNGDKR